MNEDEIRRVIEQQISPESGVSQKDVEDIVQALVELGDKKPKSPLTATEVRISELNAQMASEQDWRKRAAIAARIISLNLE